MSHLRGKCGFCRRAAASDAATYLVAIAATLAKRKLVLIENGIETWTPGQVAPLLAGNWGDQAPTRAGLIASQLLGLALCRYVLKLPPVAAMAFPPIVRAR